MDENFTNKLDSVFANINDWLKFAEQKNSTLLVLNCGLVWGVTRIYSIEENISSTTNIFNTVGYSLLVLSALICVISFMPVIRIPWQRPGDKNNLDSCVYFGDISKYTKHEYMLLLSNKVGGENSSYNEFQLDVASQIVTNSKIALQKYKSFVLSSWLTILGIISFGIGMFTKLIG